MIYSQNKH